MKSNGVKVDGIDNEQEQFEFHIVSLDNKQQHFEAASVEERDEWVQAIEQQILNSLQVNKKWQLKCFQFNLRLTIQCLAKKKLVILPISLINWPFSSEGFEP